MLFIERKTQQNIIQLVYRKHHFSTFRRFSAILMHHRAEDETKNRLAQPSFFTFIDN